MIYGGTFKLENPLLTTSRKTAVLKICQHYIAAKMTEFALTDIEASSSKRSTRRDQISQCLHACNAVMVYIS